MTVDEANALLLKLAEEHPVSSLQLGGIGMWPLVRLAMLYVVLRGIDTPSAVKARPDGAAGGLPQKVTHLGDAVLFGDWMHQPDVLLVQSHKDFTSRREGRPADPLADGLAQLVDEFSVQCLSSIGRPSLTSAQPGLVLFQEIDRAESVSDDEVRNFLGLLRPIAQDARTRTGRMVIDPFDCLAWALRILALVPAWSAALQAIEPRAVMVQNYIGLEKIALGAAARRAGIPLIDHQHGMFTRDAPVYLSWPELPPEIVDPMPSWFWLWSEWFRERMPADSSAVRTIVGGDLRHVSVPAPTFREASSRRTILYLHQPDQASRRDGVPLAPDFIELVAAAPAEWRWLVRLHPRFAGRVAAAEQQCSAFDNVEIAEPTRRPLSYALSAADAAITATSAAAFDTVDAGIPTVFTGASIRTRLGNPADPDLMIYAGGEAALVALAAAVRRPPKPIFLRKERALATSALRTILSA